MRRLTTIQCLLGRAAAYPELSTVLLTPPATKKIRLTDSTPRWVLPSKVTPLVVTLNRYAPTATPPNGISSRSPRPRSWVLDLGGFVGRWVDDRWSSRCDPDGVYARRLLAQA